MVGTKRKGMKRVMDKVDRSFFSSFYEMYHSRGNIVDDQLDRPLWISFP